MMEAGALFVSLFKKSVAKTDFLLMFSGLNDIMSFIHRKESTTEGHWRFLLDAERKV